MKQCQDAILEWMRTKGYDPPREYAGIVSLLNEIDYQARECGEAAAVTRARAALRREARR